jgi:hypothetical protein
MAVVATHPSLSDGSIDHEPGAMFTGRFLHYDGRHCVEAGESLTPHDGAVQAAGRRRLRCFMLVHVGGRADVHAVDVLLIGLICESAYDDSFVE